MKNKQHTLPSFYLISSAVHPYDTVQPTGMGMVEIPAELAEAV